MFTPQTLEIVVVSFEGPDRYSLAGGLGVRARELCRAFADLRYRTTLAFVGDPSRAAHEMDHGVHLLRCCQDVSAEHLAGVYDGERRKVERLTATMPDYIVRHIVRPAAAKGRIVAVLSEEWQTAAFVGVLDDTLRREGLRQHCILVWNANNHFGFDELDWTALGEASSITTVSRYMKHLMWPHGVNAVVVPNGIPREALRPVDAEAVGAIRGAMQDATLYCKIGRFHPDKRWHQALTAIAQLRHEGVNARLLMRGGIEPFGGAVFHHARTLGLDVADWFEPLDDAGDIVRALSETRTAAVVNLCRFVDDQLLPAVYAASGAVLANSGHEPFGLVGLEAMAAGGVAVVGGTGEEYARPYGNAVVIESDDGAELAAALGGLVARPHLERRLRAAGRRDAADYTWPFILDGLLERLQLFGRLQQVALPASVESPSPRRQPARGTPAPVG